MTKAYKLTGCDLFFSKSLSLEQVREVLDNNSNQKVDFFYFDLKQNKITNNDYDKENPNHGFFYLESFAENKKFPFKISLNTFLEISNEFYINLCHDFSIQYGLDCFCDYIHPEHPEDPYYSILFKKGQGFLVSDSDFEEDEKLTILSDFKPNC